MLPARRGLRLLATRVPRGYAGLPRTPNVFHGTNVVKPSVGLRTFSTPATSSDTDKETETAIVLFDALWEELAQSVGRENMRFPSEIMWLGGAPGSGKGTNTSFIMLQRGYTAPPVVMSDLLDTPEAQAIKAAGGMVGDREVIAILLRKLLEPQYATGVVVDGFPRTKVQASVVHELHDRLQQMHAEAANTPNAALFRRPIFRICVLFVEEKESVERQLARGKKALAHNEEVRNTGKGELWDERATDFDPKLARTRYLVFEEQTYAALQFLGQHFIYNFVNAQGSINQVEQNIVREMEYQSRMELNPETHERIRDVPQAREVVIHARQNLVTRLDSYQRDHAEQFATVVDILKRDFFPTIARHAIAGRCVQLAHHQEFRDSKAVDMALDVFFDRGFYAFAEPATGGYRFEIQWRTVTLRQG
eukprot:TRINITY_DN9137_c0_g1_i1.p1 TRINITY_DN9137_c0_g1~~TRINITY_DN9137_c0_g1_i1.p1  ORF type:complete len:421 (+),score=90.23 TRINITY_DN9137_c0_g1_i1:59-1321(+)